MFLQRVLRYPLLLRTILKLLDGSSEEHHCLLGKETVALLTPCFFLSSMHIKGVFTSKIPSIIIGCIYNLDTLDNGFSQNWSVFNFQRPSLRLKKLLSTSTKCRGSQNNSHQFSMN